MAHIQLMFDKNAKALETALNSEKSHRWPKNDCYVVDEEYDGHLVGYANLYRNIGRYLVPGCNEFLIPAWLQEFRADRANIVLCRSCDHEDNWTYKIEINHDRGVLIVKMEKRSVSRWSWGDGGY